MSSPIPTLTFTAAGHPPANPVTGMAYFDSSTQCMHVYTGAGWVQMTAPAAMTDWYLFLDDLRMPADASWEFNGITTARSTQEALDLISQNGLPKAISFDHDLGGEDTGFKFMWALIRGHLDEGWDLSNIEFIQIHSANPVGVEKLTKLWEGFCRHQKLVCDIRRVWPRSQD